jgi:hypothetical protein
MAKQKSIVGQQEWQHTAVAEVVPPAKVEADAPAQDVWDRKAKQLKVLNTMLLKEATERRDQVVALTTCLNELSANDAMLSVADGAMVQTTLAASLRAAVEEVTALCAPLVVVQGLLREVEVRAVWEVSASGEADVRLEQAAAERGKVHLGL